MSAGILDKKITKRKVHPAIQRALAGARLATRKPLAADTPLRLWHHHLHETEAACSVSSLRVSSVTCIPRLSRHLEPLAAHELRFLR